jgi:ligand-binding sensor domain-containing protein/signal transduction histidine kinase
VTGRTSSFYLLFPIVASALDPTLAISQYTHRHWQVEEGLPQNYVTAITQAPDGALLVGTSGGVARFDGFQFSPIVLQPESGLTREWINSLLVDAKGILWIGSRDAGIFRHREGLTSRPARHAAVWTATAATPSGGGLALGEGILWRLDADEWRTQVTDVPAADLNWQGLLMLPNGTVLVGGTKGLHAIRKNHATLVLPDTAPPGRVISLRAGRHGTVYAGTTEGLFRLSINGNHVAAERVTDVAGPVVSIAEDRDGSIWAATWGRGLFRVHGGSVGSWTHAEGLTDDFVHVVFEDSEGSIWVGTRGGLTRMTSGTVVPYGPAEGLHGQFISAVTGGPDGSLWIGTWRSGLYRYKGNRFTRVGLPGPDLTTLVRSLLVVKDGTLWMSDWRSLWSYDGSRWHSYGGTKLGHNSRVNAMVVDRAGSLWFGTIDGLYQHPPGLIRQPGRPWLQGRVVRCLALSRDGKLWVGTDRGLAMFDGTTMHEVGPLPHPSVVAITEDASARVWAATRAGGLTLVSSTPRITFDHRQGLPTVPILTILDDLKNSLWLSTASGIYRLSYSQVESLIKGKTTPRRYDQRDGLRTIEAQSVGQPSGWLDSRGDVWFTTVRGMVKLRPQVQRQLPPPRVLIDSTARSADGHVVRYSAIRLLASHHLEFRYRLSPGPPDWIQVGTERTLRFPSLAAGTHQLLVSARDAGGGWGDAATVQLVEPPQWFETVWFRVLLVTGAGLCLCLAYRWRMIILRGRYAAIMAERNRIAREWHDTLLAGFSAISWQLDTTLKRLAESPHTAAESVYLARKMVRHYRSEARRVVWDLRNERSESIDPAVTIRDALNDLTRDSGIAVTVDIQGAFPQLPGETSLNLLRIVQEATGNALHHASPGRIEVALGMGEDAILLSVRDDGCGFDPSHVPPGHFGLEIMRERAQKFGGCLTIESKRGRGTTVRVSIPWNA